MEFEKLVKVGDIILHHTYLGHTWTITDINDKLYSIDNVHYAPLDTLYSLLEKGDIRIISEEEKEYAENVYRHIKLVSEIMNLQADKLKVSGYAHDKSKWQEDEFGPMSKAFPIKKKAEYNSPEYNAAKESIREAIDLHYERNKSHHPHKLPNGIKDMTLGNLIEMVADWCAAAHDTPNGDVLRSIEINQETFGYSDDLKAILINTAKEIKARHEI